MSNGEIAALVVLALFMLRRGNIAQLVDGWVWPVPTWNAVLPAISQGFNEGTHQGVDILYRVSGRWVAPEGVPILAANAGTVRAVNHTQRGWSVTIDHGTVVTFYQHLETVSARAGERVGAGDELGTMGIDPMDAQQVRHLHFEVWQRVGAHVVQLDPRDTMHDWRTIPWTR